jgi:hypothetical protein
MVENTEDTGSRSSPVRCILLVEGTTMIAMLGAAFNGIFRVIGMMILITLAIFSFPLICLYLLAHVATLDPGATFPLKVALWAFGPFASSVWFAVQVRWYQRMEFSRLTGQNDEMRYGRSSGYGILGFLLSAAAGSVVAFKMGLDNPTLYFAVAILACFSPSLIHLIIRMFKGLPKEVTCNV